MKKTLLCFLALICIATGCSKNDFSSDDSQPGQSQFTRSPEFAGKYSLDKTVVFSRHHLRAPMVESGGFLSTLTNYTWHDFGVKAACLTDKGCGLETINGQFFRKWMVSEGLFAQEDGLSADKIHVIANSKERTIKTAENFFRGFIPEEASEVQVYHANQVETADPAFSTALGDDITPSQWQTIKAEYDSLYSAEKIREASLSLQPGFDLLAEILDLTNSPAYRDGTFKGFNDHNCELVLKPGDEPTLTASLMDACSVADALFLQYYEDPGQKEAAFGRAMTREEWKMVTGIIGMRDEIRFSSPFVQHYVSKAQRDMVADAMDSTGIRFAYFCGHDLNIFNMLKAMRAEEYEMPDAIEVTSPIGSKIVFEKWIGKDGREYADVMHVYQKVDQIRQNTPLDLESCSPAVIRLEFKGLSRNSDGLFPLEDILERLRE